MKIEKGFPVPHARFRFKYPLWEMEIGDSFHVEGDGQTIIRARNAISIWARRRNNERQFCTRKEDGGIRVWRIK